MLWWLSSIRIPKSNGSQAIKRWLRNVRIFICGIFPQIFLDNPAFWNEHVYYGTRKARPRFPKSQGRKEMQMKTEELDIIRDAVHNALEAVRCLGALEKKSSMILISQNDLKAYLGGNLEGKLVDAYKILEAEASTES